MAQKPAWVKAVQDKIATETRRTTNEKARYEAERQENQAQADREEAKPIISGLRQKVERAVDRGEREVPLMSWRTSYGTDPPMKPSDLYGVPRVVAQHCQRIGLQVTLQRQELPDRGEDDAVRYDVFLAIKL